MSTPVFDLQEVGKSFSAGEREVAVLRGLTFSVDLGESVAIMGPSGSGKSTLLGILGCLEAPTRGRIAILGEDTSGLSDERLSALRGRAIGFIFQSFHLLPAYDALSNAALGALYTGRGDGASRARTLLEKVGLGHRLGHRPAALSGGERQRVAIARALANDPSVLLADEPTGSLDQKSGAEILDLLFRLRAEGRTLVLVTHDPSVARRADRVLELVDGRIVRERPGASLAP